MVVLAFVLWAAVPFSLSQKNDTSEKALADLEQQWLKSQQTNNADLLEPLLADGFSNTSNEGKVANKTQAIAEAKATKFTSVDYTDLKVMVFGDTAIAIGGFKAKGADASSGKWQCIASHQSTVKM